MSPTPAGHPSRLRAWLELGRVSNAPTVVSNVLAGAAIAATISPSTPVMHARLSLACVTLYIAGMILNDAVDAAVDHRERPGRPIPSGRVSRTAAFVAAIALLAVGLWLIHGASSQAVLAGVALVAAIVLYNLLHSATVVSVALMGLCRALVYVVAAAAIVPDEAWRQSHLVWPAAMLGLYTAAFSLVARHEAPIAARAPDAQAASHPPSTQSDSELRGHQSTASPFQVLRAWASFALGVAVVLSIPAPPTARLIAAALAAAPLVLACRWALPPATPARTRRAVLGWIACFSIIDASVCAALGQYPLAAACLACFILTRLAHRRILGT